jgi:hypothetical protein
MQLSVATICLESASRAEAMLSSYRALAQQGLPTVAGDGGSSPQFVREIRRLGHRVVQAGRGLRGQMEAALEGAAELGSHVLYVESDKPDFIATQIQPTVARYRRRGLDYAVVGRTKAIFDRFPLAQRTMEIAESTLIGHVLGRPGDWVGGPAVMPAVHVATLADSSLYGTDRHGWGVPWYLLGRAHREHLTIGIIKTGCGPLASNVDEFNPGYRLLQANSILGCFHEGAGVDYDWQE